MCPIRIMLTPSIISSYFSISSQGSAGYGFKTIDILYNTTFKFKMITKFLKKFSKLHLNFIKNYKIKL